MARFNNDKKTKGDGPEHLNRIVSGAEITGNISTQTSMRIDGIVNGNVICKGKLVLGISGKIIGNISSSEAEIEGLVQGDISVFERLVLRSTALINGNIVSSQLVIEDGATFNGACSMKNIPSSIKETKTVAENQEKDAEDLVY